MKIPLPANPLKAINSYVIQGGGRFLMIDTGMNRQECMEAMQSSLRELKVVLQRTDFFITNLHGAHFGLVSELIRGPSKVYFNKPDAQICFHFHQAAEKYLKAHIIAHDLEFQKIPDLPVLFLLPLTSHLLPMGFYPLPLVFYY